MKYFTNASGGLASVDASGVPNRYTCSRGWVLDDGLTAQSLESLPRGRERLERVIAAEDL